MITGNEPVTQNFHQDSYTGKLYEDKQGLTIRQHFAAMAMQGFCSHYGISVTGQGFEVEASRRAVQIADALIAELNTY